MNLVGIVTNKDNYNINYPRKSPLSEINTADPIFIIHNRMDGSEVATYHVNLIYLLERLFVNDYNTVLSIDQERFIRRFLFEAGKVTDAINNKESEEDALENLSPIMRQLDCFLGNYTGENDGQYAR